MIANPAPGEGPVEAWGGFATGVADVCAWTDIDAIKAVNAIGNAQRLIVNDM